jgi:hypothetical protein
VATAAERIITALSAFTLVNLSFSVLHVSANAPAADLGSQPADTIKLHFIRRGCRHSDRPLRALRIKWKNPDRLSCDSEKLKNADYASPRHCRDQRLRRRHRAKELIERATRPVAPTVVDERLFWRMRAVMSDYEAALDATRAFSGKPG